jgi:E3 ubiquitin-protein ligase HUWE1
MRLKLNVSFAGEEGIDAGGVSREWYQVMSGDEPAPSVWQS